MEIKPGIISSIADCYFTFFSKVSRIVAIRGSLRY
jgi:hypothetical protein